MKILSITSLTIFCLSLTGCGETQTVITREGSRVEVQDATSEQCPDGGKVLVYGVDSDGSGALEAAEVTSTHVICNGADGQTGANSLIRTETEPAGANCAEGGFRILFGVDTDGSGVLDDDEVQGEEFLCNGLPGTGLNSLVSVMEEAAGANCPRGGFAILSGQDTSGDGLLQPGEVQGTVYVCHGQDGMTSLIRREDEPAGSNCPHGGQAILTGIDADGNGYLDDMESNSTQYICNGADGAVGADGLDNLFETVPEPAGTTCPAGGVWIVSGPDGDRDGVLDPGEVQVEQVVCNGVTGAAGADGHDSLVATTAVAPGVVCATGGVQVDSGLDVDRDGVLDAGEVTSTRVVCNGAAGSDGADGDAALVATTELAPGAVCAAGGVQVESGLDIDGDGVLDAGEVTSTQPVCNGEDGADGGIRLLRATNALWGGVCAYGGVKIDQGIDDDGDGVLGDAEVDTTQYVCNKAEAILSLSNSFGHNCLIKAGGLLWCWGNNGLGQLGIGTLADGSAIPVAVQTRSTGFSKIVTGSRHTCALSGVGAVYCWGDGTDGQLGQGNFISRTVIVNGVVGILDAVELAAGQYHSCAIRADGSMWCWGQNTYGQLGNGLTANSHTPVEVAGLTNASVPALGWDSSCVLKTDGTVWCWGRNNYGQLGNGTTTNSLVPVQAGSSASNTRIASGTYHVCTKRGLTVTCWGQNTYGQLGDGTTTQRNTPTAVNSTSWFGEVSCSSSHTCTLLLGGNVACWGQNTNGQVGDGTYVQRNSPVSSVSGFIFSTVSVGSGHSCGVKADGTAWCWGSNSNGLLGNGSGVPSLVPVQVDPGELAP